MSLEEAVRRWTWVPASVFGMHDRGLIREGMKADVVVFASLVSIRGMRYPLFRPVPENAGNCRNPPLAALPPLSQ